MREPFVYAERGRPNEDGDYKVQQEFRTDGVTNTLGRNINLNILVDSGERMEYKDIWTRGELNGMKVNSFFCGAGGFDLGFIQAGFEIVGAWDFDKYAVQSYNHNIGGAEQADVTQMKGKDLKKANGWLFGFPCQDISVAGKQQGFIMECKDCGHHFDKIKFNCCNSCGSYNFKPSTRSGLFYEIMRLLGEVSDKPEWILAENVKAVKKFIPEIREEYAKAGYWLVEPQLYNSKYWGVPQNRERYFLLGIRFDNNKPFSFPQQQTDFIPKLSSVLESEVDEKFYIDDLKVAKIIEQAMSRIELKDIHSCITPDRVDKQQNGRRAKPNEEEMFTITAQDLYGVIQQTPKIEMLGLLDMKGNETVRRVYDVEGLSPTLTTSEGGHRQPKILEIAKETGLLCEDGVGKTLRVGGKGSLSAKHNYEHLITPQYRVRKLTPREYARLQGFPESYEQIVSNSQFYKQMGNAVTVNVAHAIATAIKEQL